MGESESTDLMVDIKANPNQGLSFILWNACSIVIDARNPIIVRFDTMDGLEDTLEPYWDAIYKARRDVNAKIAQNWDPRLAPDRDRYVLRMRYRALRALMFRKHFDGEKDMEYDDDL